MTKGKSQIFKDPNKLQEMFTLRKAGWSSTLLSKKYGCDHTTILYECRKYGIYPERLIRINKERIIMATPKPIKPKTQQQTHKYAHLIFEPLNQGKMYRSYLEQKKVTH